MASILLVDDDVAASVKVATLLEVMGLEVAQASEGHAGLARRLA